MATEAATGLGPIEYLHSQTLNRYIDKRKKSGKLILSDFNLPQYLYSLRPLSRWFRENIKSIIVDCTHRYATTWYKSHSYTYMYSLVLILMN